MNYNLLQEQWIPVLYRDGRCSRVGIVKALEDASRIRQIAASNPMDRIAISRFLLALLYWCKGNPPTDMEPTSVDSFPAQWFSKLKENVDCFNLLGDGRRFYQDRAAQRSRAVTDLIQEIPTGNNFWHFRHSTDEKDGLCPACCAMGLLRLPLFSVSGLPDLRAGINGSPPVYVLPWATTLLETLRANWRACADVGVPAWVQRDLRSIAGSAVALLTGLTLLSRRVWLHEPIQGPGECIGCGEEGAPLIHTCEFQTAGKQENALWDDPHVVYSNATPRKALRTPDLTAAKKFRMDRPWPNLLVQLESAAKFGYGTGAPRLLIVGFATDQAKNIDVWERTIDLSPIASLQGATALEAWQKEGGRLEERISRIVRSKIAGAAAIADIRPQVEHKVSARAGSLLAADDAAWKEAAEEYRPMMQIIAESLSAGFTTAAVERRRQIAAVMPDMEPKTESAKQSRRKKEGQDK